MSYFENLWEEYRDLQLADRDLAEHELEQVRAAFLTGAWCHMAFQRRLQGLHADVAAEVMRDVEEELFSAMSPPEPTRIQFDPTPARRFTN